MYAALTHRRKSLASRSILVTLTLLSSCSSPLFAAAPNWSRSAQNPQALGPIAARGAVSLNGVRTSSDATVFVGDTIRTGPDGTAVLSISGKGSFRVASDSEISFAPDPRYTGELKSGTVVMGSFGGATDISLRVGNYVVAPVIQTEQSASRIERRPDASFTVACLEGSVGLIPLEGTTGRVLKAGESANILPSGELEQAQTQSPLNPAAPAEKPAETPGQLPTQTPTTAGTTPSEPPPPVAASGSSKKNEYILLGVAGAAAVGIAAGLAGRGHGSPSVSPSTP
jgi:hypothetical protein